MEESKRKVEEDSLLSKLTKYSLSEAVAMHMPGHKRNVDAFPYLNARIGDIDITEINDFDDLHNANGILKQSMDIAAEVFHCKKSWFLVNGSTCGILAAIRALSSRGDKVIVARNCHLAVYNALEMFGLQPIYVQPLTTPYGILGSIDPASIEQAFSKNCDVSLVIVTSPTYEGVISDIKSISEIAHANGARVFVDGAHGAHLDLSPYFLGSARENGADVVVESLHKTLPSPTQTAILHLCSDRANAQEIENQLSVFETSSPSYALMSGIDGCMRFLKEDKGESFKKLSALLDKIEVEVKDFSELKVLGYGKNKCLDSTIFAFDRTKIVVMFGNMLLPSKVGGSLMASNFRDRFSIECEFAKNDYVLALTSIGDTDKSIGRLIDAIVDCGKIAVETMPYILEELEEFILSKKDDSFAQKILTTEEEQILPSRVFYPWEIENKELESIATSEFAVARICAEYIWAYPPGIPIIVPGEILTYKDLVRLKIYQLQDCKIHTTCGGYPDHIMVVKNLYAFKNECNAFDEKLCASKNECNALGENAHASNNECNVLDEKLCTVKNDFTALDKDE